jgi:multidrug resistance protein
MADPEVQLPPAPEDGLNHSYNTDVQLAESEKFAESEKDPERDSSSSSIARIGSQDEIVYHYLTFETQLPSPAYLSQPDYQHSTQASPPSQCPNLDKYISPFHWSSQRKTIITCLSCAATALTAYTAGSYSSGSAQMQDEWNVSETAIAVGITTFTCGFGIAPMVLAPFSEINGRRPIFVVTGVLFVIFQLICAVTPTYAGMLVSRFLAGCCSSTFSTMVGGVVSDIYHAEERNTAMALFSGSALFGTGLGPIISGVVAQHTTWRWIFYLQVITCGVMMVFIIFFFKETRGSVLLSKKAKALNKWMAQLESEGHHGFMMPISSTTTTTTTTKPVSPTAPQRIRWKVKSDEERTSLGRMIGISLYRPFHLLFTESVVFFFSLWISFSWAVLYLTFSAIPLVFTTSHDFSLQQNGAVFTAISVAAVISTCISVAQEHIARKYFTGKQRAIFDGPEGRLYFACIQSALLPIGCFWFGWTSFPSNHWILPALGIGCSTMGIFSIYLAVFNYLADTYHRYASSALAAQSFCRNILAGAFPLFTPQMFKVMTFQGAGSFLGGMGALLTIVPWVLVFYGPRIRARSKFAREIMD